MGSFAGMELDDVKAHSERLGPWAYLATSHPDGEPHVVPVHPSWDGEQLVVATSATSRKARNLVIDPRCMLHWTVGPDTGFDHLMVVGMSAVLTTETDRHRLFEGTFDYDLRQFWPGGPDDPGVCFLSIELHRATLLKAMGAGGREVWPER